MWSTPGPRRLFALTLSAVLGAALASAPTSAASADPARPTTPAVTAGPNGRIAWTQLYVDPATSVITDAVIRVNESAPSYSHADDPEARLREAEWSPDGTRLAYRASGGVASEEGIWVVDHPFRNPGRRVQITHNFYDGDPTWSPDGTKIAYGSTVEGIFVVDADGGTPVQILRDVCSCEDLTWSPDGSRIAYSEYSGRAGSSPRHIYVIDVDGGAPVDLGPGAAPSWSPDGTKIAFQYLQTASNWDVYWMNPDGTGRLQLLNAGVNEMHPSWSPDGKQMAFVTPAGIYRYNHTNGDEVLVASGSYFESPTWAADQPVCQGRQVTMSGTAAADVLRGSDGVDVIHGMGGDDTILGLQGQDVLCGGTGSDTVSYEGQTAPATAYLGETSPAAGVSDLIATDVENLLGGAGPDTLVGDERINRIEGGDGADEITGGAGVDNLVGGRGDDTLVGGDGDDALIGGGGDDLLVGEEGADQMSGAAGEDVLRGGEGADSVDGGLDADLLAGGPGIDTAQYGGRLIGVLVTLGAGGADDGSREDGTLGERDTVRGSVENVTGGSGADTLVGSEVANQLTGGAGADELRGGDGRDVLRANDGIKDRVIDCGDGDDAAAIRDSIDPAPISCP